jgi:hypothetical protein
MYIWQKIYIYNCDRDDMTKKQWLYKLQAPSFSMLNNTNEET